MADADIVVGYGRSVLEAMAMGRAAYVWDHAGGDGWVTPETYPDPRGRRLRRRRHRSGHRRRSDAGRFRRLQSRARRLRLRPGPQASLRPRARGAAGQPARRRRASRPHPTTFSRPWPGWCGSRHAPRSASTSLEAEIGQMWEEVQAARDRADVAEAKVRVIEGSRSWRFAAPLRRLAARLRRRG